MRGDGLEGHELWQHANLNQNGYAGKRLSSDASKGNYVIALPKGIHKDVNYSQSFFNARAQSPIDNIMANNQILKNHPKIPNTNVNDLLRKSLKHYRDTVHKNGKK